MLDSISRVPVMSAAGIYTAEDFVQKMYAYLWRDVQNWEKKLFWNQCNNF
jgi:hypothetical protein